MPIEIPKRSRADLIESIQDYVHEHLDLELGVIAAEGILDYALAEIGPAAYNKGVRDAQSRMNTIVGDLDLDLREQEMGYSLRRRAEGRG